MEIVGAVAGGVTGPAIGHVEREVRYLFHFRKSIKTLKDNIRQLEATKRDVQEMIDTALRNDKLINDSVEDWKTKADRVLVQARNLSEEASVIKGRFKGWFYGRFSLGRKAQKINQVIQGLYAEGSGFGDNISHSKPYQSLKPMGIEDFNPFASRESTAKEICKALEEDATNLVGVYGMPGVGKTTLIKAIANQVKEERLFQEVVVVTVSQNPSYLKLQDDIAEKLDFKGLGVDLSVRADRLCARLNQDAKTLVVLDDVWEKIKLSEVGIPYKNNGKCCKVVFATRSEDVCDEMEADTKIQVSVLSEEDSWFLFQQKSGNIEDSSLARDLLKECKGLPLAIVTLGLALRGKDAIVWADVLVQLRKSIFEGMMSPVVFSIKLSYDYLLSKSVKICFLYCCLFPEDHKIKLDVLLRYMMGEKLLENVETYDEARNRLHGIVVKLVSCGLLLRDKEEETMMHDVVRDVAISIAAEEERHIVEAGRNLNYWRDMDLETCKRLSMMYNPIEHFPTIPIKAPNLQALFLNNNYKLTELPSDFFTGMKSLMTLDLSETAIKSLPQSLSCLENLRTLLLKNTILKNLSPIENLARLEVLTLDHCSFWNGEVLEQIGNLRNLRILDLKKVFLSNSISVRPAPFSKLHRLEEFHVLEVSRFQENKVDIIREIGTMSRLTSLEVRVYDAELCYIDIPGPWQNLTKFQIAMDTKSQEFVIPLRYISRRLCLSGIQGKELGNWVLALLGRTNSLEIELCEDLQSLSELGSAAVRGMNENLKSLYLWSFSKMECLVSSHMGSNQNAILSYLEILSIGGMGAFVEICKGTPPRILQNLKELTIYSCGGLVTAIPGKLIHNLRNLESLKIAGCNDLMHVVEMEEEEEESVVSSNMSPISEDIQFNQDTAILPSLKKLHIEDAPKLKSFSNQINLVMNLPSLEELYVRKCGMLERLPFATTSLLKIKHVMVGSTSIRYMFTMRAEWNLLQLEEVDIRDCPELEVIFKYEGGADIQCDQKFIDIAVLPRLKKLMIWNAPQLKSFTNQNQVMKFPSLQELDVQHCGMLERLPFGTTSLPNLNTFRIRHIPKLRYVFTVRVEDGEVILPHLKSLKVEHAPQLKSFTNQNLVIEFPSLEKLYVRHCEILERLAIGTSVAYLRTLTVRNIPKIRYVFTMRVAQNLLQLEEVDIYECQEMEFLFKYEDGEDIQFNEDTAILPRLRWLQIWNAPQLISFTNQINLVMEMPSLEYLKVVECFMLERLPFFTTSALFIEFDRDRELFDGLELQINRSYYSEEEDEIAAEELSNSEKED